MLFSSFFMLRKMANKSEGDDRFETKPCKECNIIVRPLRIADLLGAIKVTTTFPLTDPTLNLTVHTCTLSYLSCTPNNTVLH